ncbi:BrnT family toxin [Pollutimonas bauzanensis]|uniref:Uncharacterized protein n=1 Tax=Pollutimonas bauzanensis TaxID=658167 RepID=A0A1M5UL38_9BURK|nr:BrnT family toxin [Pollutimonas bauzanensis]SHH63772.1 hypothetical protein SAMN04488135_10434 [Pollutimonas bauzanensis]
MKASKKMITVYFVGTIIMNYEHDPRKLAANVYHHGIWFSEAEFFEWETATITVDARNHYAETRFQAIGYIGRRLFVLVFCFRLTSIRIISLRKANARELNRYAKT